MKTAGLRLDFYDDPSLLKEKFPTADELPNIVKEAYILSDGERDVLRDEAYALILLNEGRALRKFACVDAGNTFLSVLYFLENMDNLPEEATKVAAANLLERCEEFGIEAPLLLKTSAMSRTRDPFKTPIVGDEADWAQRTNLVSVRGGADSGKVMTSANTMKTASANKVDISGLQAPIKVKRSSAKLHALGDQYPLDSYADVQKAVEFFGDFGPNFSPAQRHEFCIKTASRANELGIEMPDDMMRYGSTEYAPDVEAHLANRRAIVEKEWKPVYDELQEKRASVDPETFAQLLAQVDEATGLNYYYGGEVADPYYATFGGISESEKTAAWSWQSRVGDYVSEEQLTKLATNGRPLIHKHFSSEITNAFVKDPIAIFDSLPDNSKVILARLASGEFDGLATN
jgi:hypothetical protein